MKDVAFVLSSCCRKRSNSFFVLIIIFRYLVLADADAACNYATKLPSDELQRLITFGCFFLACRITLFTYKMLVTCIITYFTEMFEKKDREIKELQAHVSMLETHFVKLEQQIHENSAHERKNTLRMAGTIPPAQHEENCKFVVREQIREHLRLELAIEDISVAHRIGVKHKIQGKDKCNIMFKLCNRDVKPKKFYINESLTPLINTSKEYLLYRTPIFK